MDTEGEWINSPYQLQQGRVRFHDLHGDAILEHRAHERPRFTGSRSMKLPTPWLPSKNGVHLLPLLHSRVSWFRSASIAGHGAATRTQFQVRQRFSLRQMGLVHTKATQPSV